MSRPETVGSLRVNEFKLKRFSVANDTGLLSRVSAGLSKARTALPTPLQALALSWIHQDGTLKAETADSTERLGRKSLEYVRSSLPIFIAMVSPHNRDT